MSTIDAPSPGRQPRPFWRALLPIFLLSLLALTLACGSPGADSSDTSASGDAAAGDTGQDGETPPLVIYEIVPTSATLEGGIPAYIGGTGFLDGATLKFGSANVTITALSSSRIDVLVPPSPSGAPGFVDVVLQNPGALPYVLPLAFEYVDTSIPKVDRCRLHFPPSLLAEGGQASPEVTGRVRMLGRTDGVGAGEDIVGELGFGPAGTHPRSDGYVWEWTPARWARDVYGEIPGDQLDDEYSGSFVIDELGAFAYTYRFSSDGGATWRYCDLDDDGSFDPERLGQAEVLMSLEPRITWCNIASPAELRSEPGEDSASVFGDVYGKGVTDADEAAESLRVELGLGAWRSLPEDAAGDWTWSTGSYISETLTGPGADAEGERYGGPLSADDAGRLSFLWRVSDDQGLSWLYCDLDGSQNGVDRQNLGLLRVGSYLESCRLELQDDLSLSLGEQSQVLAATVFAVGITEGFGPGSYLEGQIGYGPADSDPQAVGAPGWVWHEAGYLNDASAGEAGDTPSDDMYVARLSPAAEGSYRIAFRFRTNLSQQGEWLTCDKTGTDDGFELEDLPLLTVLPPAAYEVDDCRLRGPVSLQVEAGSLSQAVDGLLFSGGHTPGPGPAEGVLGSLGARGATGDWIWTPASYVGDEDGDVIGDKAYDRYSAAITLSVPGVYDSAYRFSTDEGLSWTLCDRGGSADGFDDDDTGSIIVYADVKPVIDEVTLRTSLGEQSDLAAVAGWHSAPFFCDVRIPGFTEKVGSGALAKLAVEIGRGPPGSIPALSEDWEWVAATYEANQSALAELDDVYVASLDTSTVGLYDVAARASVDAGAWVYGDTDGSSNGYATQSALALEVVAPATGVADGIDWCNLHHPPEVIAVTGVASETIRGQLFISGQTNGAGWASGVVASVGYGPGASHPEAADWSWFDAWYATDADSNDEYRGQIIPHAAGDYVTAYRFSLDAGANWTFCDLDGPPYGMASAGSLSVE